MVLPGGGRGEVHSGRHLLADRYELAHTDHNGEKQNYMVGRGLRLQWFIMLGVQLICSPETGGITISPRPGPDDSPPKPGFPTRPFFGIEPVLVDLEVRTSMLELPQSSVGLVCTERVANRCFM